MSGWPVFFEGDGVTPATPMTIGDVGEGDVTATFERWVYNDPDLSHSASTMTGLRLLVLALDGTEYVPSGLPLVNQLWARVKVLEVDNAADPTMPQYSTGLIPAGADSDVRLPDLPPGCGIKVAIYFKIPDGQQELAHSFALDVADDGNSMPLRRGATLATGTGIIPGYRDHGLRRIVEGLGVTASGGNTVTFERGRFDFDETEAYVPQSTSAAISQNDVNASALVAGEKYVVAVTQKSDKTVTLTKGAKSAGTPTKPDLPADEIFRAWVTINYGAGGTVINTADIDTTGVVRTDYSATVDALELTIHSGTGVTSTDLLQFTDAVTIANLTPSATNYVWRLSNGHHQLTTTADLPEPGADLIYEYVTDGSGVTGEYDHRKYVDVALIDEVMLLQHADEATAAVAKFAWAPILGRRELHEVIVECADIGDGSGGSLKVDVLTFAAGEAMGGAGTSIYTSSGTDDRRPAIAFGATMLRTVSRDHDTRRFADGTRFTASILAVPTGAATGPTDVRVYLRFRRY
jgi:hypothetical protein